MSNQSNLEQGKEMSEEERERFIDEAASQFARLFLQQVLDQRRSKKDGINHN